MCQLLMIPSSVTDANGRDAVLVPAHLSSALTENASHTAAAQVRAKFEPGADIADAAASTDAAASGVVGDSALVLSGTGLGGALLVGLLILAAVNSRKRPLRFTRSSAQPDR